ncbi:hypothetical protein BGW38_006351, partial [Lunasporangiospora selenospora]
ISSNSVEVKNPVKKINQKKKTTVEGLQVKHFQPTIHTYIPSTDIREKGDSSPNDNENEASPAYKLAIDGLLDWLETGNNYSVVYSQAKTSVGLRTETTANAWERAARYVTAYVNKARGTTENQVRYSGPAIRERANRYKAKYFAVARAAMGTGVGVSEESGADNVSQQLDHDLRHYDRMEKLFGNNPHLIPAFCVSTGRNKDQNIIKFSSRTINVEVQNAFNGNRVDQGSPKEVLNVESWASGGTNGQLKEDVIIEADRSSDQEPREVSEGYEGEAYRRHRSQQGSVTSIAESKKRAHENSKKDLETVSSSNSRRTKPLDLYSHQPVGKNDSSVSTDMINELLGIRLLKSKGKADNPDPGKAHIQHEREMALNQQKHQQEIEVLQRKSELDLKRLKGEALLHGIVTNMSQKELDAIEARFNRMIGSASEAVTDVNADLALIAKSSILCVPNNPAPHSGETSVSKAHGDNSTPLADDAESTTL